MVNRLTVRHAWRRPAIFGAFDGVTCLLGVMLPLLGHPQLLLRTAVGEGLAGAVGMAAGEWLSESESGLFASVAIGIGSGLGVVLPALPFGLMPAAAARWASLVLLLGVVAVIAWLRAEGRGRRRAFAESYLILAAVAAAVWCGGLM